MNNTKFEIKMNNLDSPEVAELLREHLRCMSSVSPRESCHALDLEGLRSPEITFWSVYTGGELAGCGALRALDPRHGEIKSMRTAQAHLRKGVGSFVLQQIIAEAERRGYRRLSLETGSMAYFKPAHSLYRKFGFTPCPPFAEYREDPNSLFMSRTL